MRKHLCFGIVIVTVLFLCSGPPQAAGQGLLKNAGFEGDRWQTYTVGTSISSWLAVDWHPWSILGDQVNNREVEYKLITLETGNTPDLRSHVHSGNHAQQFFTNGATHTAGFYQRLQVPANSQVTFTIWVQIQTGQDLLYVDGRYVSDLGSGGNYFVQAGIDPEGHTPAHFGAPLPDSIHWSDPMWDITAHGQDEKGNPADLWVSISVPVQARGEWITVYTRGQSKYPTKYNSSFWDDASLAVSQPPAPTKPLHTMTPSPGPTSTPTVTDTPVPTDTPTIAPSATQTPTAAPSSTPLPTATSTASQTPTSMPTETSTPTTIPAATSSPTPIRAAVARPTLAVKGARTPTPAPRLSAFGDPATIGLMGVGLAIAAAMGAGLLLGKALARRD